MTDDLDRLSRLQFTLLVAIPISVAFYGVPLLSLFGARVRSYTIAVAAFFVVSILVVLRTDRRVRLLPPATAAVSFLGVALVSIVYNGAASGSLLRITDMFTALVQLVFNVSLLVFAGSIAVSRRRLLVAVRTWVGFTFLLAIYGIYQAFARTFDLPFAYLEFLVRNAGGTYAFIEPFKRPSALFGEPSFFGVYLAPPFIITAAYVILSDQSIFSRRVDELAMYVLGIGIVLSFSLGTHVPLLVAFVTGTPFLLLRSDYEFQWVPVARLIGSVFAVGAIFLAIGIQLFSAIILRILSLFEFLNLTNVSQIGSSFAIRFAAIATGFNIWLHNPVLGVGVNNARYYIDAYATIPFEVPPQIFDRVQSTGSAWMEALVGTGVVGFVLFVLVYVFTFRSLLSSRPDDDHLRVLSTGFVFVLLFNVVNMFVTYTLYHPQRWFILAMCLVVVRLGTERAYCGSAGRSSE